MRGPAQTARSFASRVEQELPEDASRAFRALTERYLQLRFADGEPAAAASHRSPDASAELRRLRDSLRA